MSKEIVNKARELLEEILNEQNYKYTVEMDDFVDEGKNFCCSFLVEPDQYGFFVWHTEKKEFKFAVRNDHRINYMKKEGFSDEQIDDGPVWVDLSDFNEFVYFLTHPLVKK